MVNSMHMPVNAFEMHEPMCPIKIKVVKDHCDRKADEQIEQSIVRNNIVDISIARFN